MSLYIQAFTFVIHSPSILLKELMFPPYYKCSYLFKKKINYKMLFQNYKKYLKIVAIRAIKDNPNVPAELG